MNKDYESHIMQTMNFQVSQQIKLSQLANSEHIHSLYTSPYNSLVIVEYYNQCILLRVLYKYENGSLIPLFKIEDYIKFDKCKQCLFMKHTNEFIILYDNEAITCYKIEQGQTLKIFQNIYLDRGFSITLDENELTLYISNEQICIYKRKTPNHVWVPQLYIAQEQKRKVTLDYGCNTLTTQWKDIYIFKCHQKIRRFRKFRSFFDTVITHIQDEFIITTRTIIQWNKQTRKQLRRYKPNIENIQVFFNSFDTQTQLFVCLIREQISICRFINGKFIVVQILPHGPKVRESQIGNNGQLLIQSELDQLIIYEQKK